MQLFRLYLVACLCVLLLVAGCRDDKHPVVKKTSISYSRFTDSLIKSPLRINPVVDSLKKEMPKVSSREKAIDILNDLASEYRTPPGTMLTLAKEGLALSQKYKYATGEATAYIKMGFYYYWVSQFDSASFYYKKALDLATEKKLLDPLCKVHTNIGLVLTFQNRIDSALTEYSKALLLSREIKNRKQEMTVICFMGEIQLFMGQIEKSKELLEKGLKLAQLENNLSKQSFCLLKLGDLERLRNNYPEALRLLNETILVSRKNKDNPRVAFCLSSMGDIYSMLGDTVRAISIFDKSIEYCLRADDYYLLAGNYTRLGEVYLQSKKYEKAKFYFTKGLKLDKQLSNPITTQFCRHGLAEVYRGTRQFDSALVLLKRVEKFAVENNDNNLLSSALRSQSIIYGKTGKPDLEQQTALAAYKAAEKTKIPYNLQRTASNLYDLYLRRKNYREALTYYTQYVTQRDSITNERQIRKFAAAEFNIKEEKLKSEQAHVEARLNAEKAVKDKEIENQRVVNMALIIGAALMVLVLLVSLRAYRNKKKANELVEKQKSEVEQQKWVIEEKQKEIVDSINYAKRLQHAILATPEEIRKHLPHTFLLYKPKDIVAGDFYFFETTDTHIFIAAADCTGHGVPGALVSVVCSNALTRCVKEFNLSDPGKILDKASELVVTTFEKSGTDVKDGMDISLLVLHKTSGEITWAGAHNALWYVQQGQWIEITSTKRPVGKSDNSLPFTTHTITRVPNTVFYLITDGYADQFGGPKGAKFKKSNLVKLLQQGAQLPVNEQRTALANHFENWKGLLEQVDDVCVIGVRIS